MNHLNNLFHNELVIDLLNFHFKKNQLCDVCQKDKQVKTSFKYK